MLVRQRALLDPSLEVRFDHQLRDRFDGCRLARMVLVEPDQAELPGWEELHPAEREWLADRAPRRLRELVAGRSALRRALVEAGWSGDQPLLAEVGGGPQLPPDFTGSISHKAGQAMQFKQLLEPAAASPAA